jgi:hypothetical protein
LGVEGLKSAQFGLVVLLLRWLRLAQTQLCQHSALNGTRNADVGIRAPVIRGALPLLGSATGSQGSLRRMSHEKTLLTSQSVQ